MKTRRFIDHRNMDASKLTYNEIRAVLFELSQVLVAGFIPNSVPIELARRTGIELNTVETILSCELRYLLMKRGDRGRKPKKK